MKTAAYILAGLALTFCAALAGLLIYILHKSEADKNRARTEPARAARWPKQEENLSNHVNLNKDEIKS